MTCHIVVAGAGYAGMTAAVELSRRLGPDRATLTVINDRPDFVERVRLHQLVAGQHLPTHPLRDLLHGTGAALTVGRITALDPDRRTLQVDDSTIRYDVLVYALGSVADTATVPGVATHALRLATLPDAQHAAAELALLADHGGTVGVVGGGATGIEAATELAESLPGLHVTLFTDNEPGSWLSPRARTHLRRVFRRLGVTVHAGTRVARVGPHALTLADGTIAPVDATLWTTGFAVPPLAADAGLTVDTTGRALVDDTLRSLSHPDIFVVGDAALAHGPGDRPLRMACGTGMPMGWFAARAVDDRLAGRQPRRHRVFYLEQNLSLGRHDGLIQYLHADDTPRAAVLAGRPGACVKEVVVRGTMAFLRRLPRHRARRGMSLRRARRVVDGELARRAVRAVRGRRAAGDPLRRA